MSGKIEVLSSPSKGSTFIATIPFKLDNSQTQALSLQKFVGQTALLLDDWEPSRLTNAKTLESAGFSVSTFSDIRKLIAEDLKQCYVFISIPYKTINLRGEIIEYLSKFNIDNLVFLFSGPSPSTQQINKLQKPPKFMRLPLMTRKLKDIDERPVVSAVSKEQTQLASLPAIKVLAVDDMELNLRLLKTWLDQTKASLDLAFSAEEAIKRCRNTEYDLILMDIQMPNMDGMQASAHIRKTPLNIGTPIIAVTAHALASQKQHFLDSGMDDFLAKPISLDKLIAIVKLWCEQEPSEDTQQSIDWLLAVSRSGGSTAEAFQFLEDFVDQLKGFANSIEQAWKAQDAQAVIDKVHKMHGACYYTGVPRLEACSLETETLLKTSPLERNSKTISTLLFEIEQTIEEWENTREGRKHMNILSENSVNGNNQ